MEKQIKKAKIWTVVFKEYKDGTTTLERTNQGFYSFELLGIVEQTKQDLLKQMAGSVKPNKVKRKVIE